MGLMGWIREHLGLKLLLARHVSQCNPASQLSFSIHVFPSYDPQPNKSRKNKLTIMFFFQNPFIKLRSLHDPFLSSWWLATWRQRSSVSFVGTEDIHKGKCCRFDEICLPGEQRKSQKGKRIESGERWEGRPTFATLFPFTKRNENLKLKKKRQSSYFFTTLVFFCVKILMNSKKQINKSWENKREE